MGAITAQDYENMSGISRGGKEVSAEVQIVRELEPGEGWHFDTPWTFEDYSLASALSNKLTSDAKKIGYKVKTKRHVDPVTGKPNGVVVLRIDEDDDDEGGDEDAD
jgi:hypothetical protein